MNAITSFWGSLCPIKTVTLSNQDSHSVQLRQSDIQNVLDFVDCFLCYQLNSYLMLVKTLGCLFYIENVIDFKIYKQISSVFQNQMS